MGEPVTQQPGGTTVVVQQQMMAAAVGGGMHPQNVEEWTSGLFGCFSNCSSCFMGWLCFWCLMCKVTQRMGECVCTPFCFGPAAVVAMRTKLRAMYGIKGAVWKDICATQCCFQLTVCQMDREMENRGTTL